MKKLLKAPKIQRKCHTQQPQTYYPQHLLLKKKKLFEKFIRNPEQQINEKRQNFCQETNFGFTLTNQYTFVLLHLKSKNNKNRLNINIPQVCIFADKTAQDIVYSENGFVRGFKSSDLMKCRLKDLELTFKQAWKNKKQSKFEHISAVFKEKQVLILSQTDFIIICKKIKSDPFFKKLEYIQNKLPLIGQQIICEYDQTTKDEKILKLATQSLMGFKSQQDATKQLGEQKYLSFLNQKISLTLNYQHNIRISRANFHYVKNQNNEYFLVNVTNLHLFNLTKALKLRQQKMKKMQQQRDKILVLTPQKERKYKSYQNPKQVKRIQSLMKANFENLVIKMNMLTISQSKNQQIKNQLAFKKLHPQIKGNYRQFLNGTDFKKTKQKLFGSTISNRKPISIPSRYILRSYNKVKRSYTLANQSVQFNEQVTM